QAALDFRAQYQASTSGARLANVPAMSLSCSIPITASTRPVFAELDVFLDKFEQALLAAGVKPV
ncbi:hypothetical protein, partial [Klebsiella pneumoniae]|uniref:hypothetical protein n=1 Tax=Klebsiella pneumoniae TaxID=573 RepID=UPI003F7A2D70